MRFLALLVLLVVRRRDRGLSADEGQGDLLCALCHSAVSEIYSVAVIKVFAASSFRGAQKREPGIHHAAINAENWISEIAPSGPK